VDVTWALWTMKAASFRRRVKNISIKVGFQLRADKNDR